VTDASPDTPIAELFARDPYDLSNSDLDAIVAKLRSQRSRYVLGDKTAGSPKPSKISQKQQAAAKITGDLDLDDLGL
jgi:hypothetical protein